MVVSIFVLQHKSKQNITKILDISIFSVGVCIIVKGEKLNVRNQKFIFKRIKLNFSIDGQRTKVMSPELTWQKRRETWRGTSSKVNLPETASLIGVEEVWWGMAGEERQGKDTREKPWRQHFILEAGLPNVFAVLLRNNWHALLYKFKLCGMMVWLTYIVKWYHNRFG